MLKLDSALSIIRVPVSFSFLAYVGSRLAILDIFLMEKTKRQLKGSPLFPAIFRLSRSGTVMLELVTETYKLIKMNYTAPSLLSCLCQIHLQLCLL